MLAADLGEPASYSTLTLLASESDHLEDREQQISNRLSEQADEQRPEQLFTRRPEASNSTSLSIDLLKSKDVQCSFPRCSKAFASNRQVANHIKCHTLPNFAHTVAAQLVLQIAKTFCDTFREFMPPVTPRWHVQHLDAGRLSLAGLTPSRDTSEVQDM